MHLKTMAVIAGMLVTLYGCISVGRTFESDDLSWIHKNKTTKDDVYDELGEPYGIGTDAGKPTWTYTYNKYSLFSPAMTKYLVVYFNKDWTVESYSFSTSFPEEKELWKENK